MWGAAPPLSPRLGAARGITDGNVLLHRHQLGRQRHRGQACLHQVWPPRGSCLALGRERLAGFPWGDDFVDSSVSGLWTRWTNEIGINAITGQENLTVLRDVSPRGRASRNSSPFCRAAGEGLDLIQVQDLNTSGGLLDASPRNSAVVLTFDESDRPQHHQSELDPESPRASRRRSRSRLGSSPSAFLR